MRPAQSTALYLTRYVVDHITGLLWRMRLCGLARSSGGISAFRRFSAPHNFGVTLWGECSFPLFSRRFDYVRSTLHVSFALARYRTGPCWRNVLPYLTHLANQGYCPRHPADGVPVISM